MALNRTEQLINIVRLQENFTLKGNKKKLSHIKLLNFRTVLLTFFTILSDGCMQWFH